MPRVRRGGSKHWADWPMESSSSAEMTADESDPRVS